MKRNDFLKSLAVLATTPMTFVGLHSCKKDEVGTDSCKATASETEGPFPTKDPSSVNYVDITSDRTGTPLTIQIFVRNINNGCAALGGVIVDVWHCDADGNYSEYGGTTIQSTDHTSEHFLRGRQTTDANGMAAFTSIYPGWYPGRAPHIHVHIYTSTGASLLISQIAFPDQVSSAVYSQGMYTSRGQADTLNTEDGIFKDSIPTELATVTGNSIDGYVLTHAINVKA
jgi:protocatechuate 3,4-dioxygenase beta subunit